jgi:hypothetical protein
VSGAGFSGDPEAPPVSEDVEGAEDSAEDAVDVAGLLAGASELAGGALAAGAPCPQAESSSAPDAPTADRKTREIFGFAISLASLCSGTSYWLEPVRRTCDVRTGLLRIQ